ncbi:receptor-like protein kinase ANXUR2 [Arachis stenosperma]|uniref:receptor-like protein kinase ANXUR2 n=1 Tax=Arachis stenosperma TaxID=217475 RepID=UPI0025AC419D|nr:receptor-like protein kinase ANXUR2 [Arachis stenosperma]
MSHCILGLQHQARIYMKLCLCNNLLRKISPAHLPDLLEHASPSKKPYPSIIEELCPQFSLEDLRKSTNNFDANHLTEISAYNRVYKCCIKHNGASDFTVALKRLNRETDLWKFKKEIEFHFQLHHPNLVSLIGFCNHKDEKILVYEHMSNGSLYDYLYSKNIEDLSWKKLLEICIGAAKGLHYLHTGTKCPIFHCDMKPHNILLDKNMVPKISHLGFSLQGPPLNSKPKPVKVDKVMGSAGYIAPEHVLTRIFTDKCDVYSFGMVLIEVVSTTYKHTIFDKIIMLESSSDFSFDPFDLMNPFVDISEMLERFSVDEIIDPILMRKIAPECLAVFIDVTKRCLSREANERPNIGEVEVELELALALQAEADDRNHDGGW